MTAAEKAVERVVIAKDVIKQIAAGRLVARHNIYFQAEDVENTPSAQLCDLLRGKTCIVCAKGAVFVAMLDRFNEITLLDSGGYISTLSEDDPTGELSFGGGSIKSYVCELFGSGMLNEIEYYFEGSSFTVNADRFYGSYANAEERPSAIMRNIIANGGDFKPEQLKGVKAALSESRSAT
jgi:hypothetical protein